MAVCVVTGGAGFVGSHLVQALVARGDEVRVVDNLASGSRNNLAFIAKEVRLVEGDIADRTLLDHVFTGAEVVFHQAALASVPRSLEDPLATHTACATGTLNVLLAARQAGVRRVVYAASSSAYGDQPTPVKRESDLPAPLSPYAAAKLAGEAYCQAFYASFGLETVALRYFNVFGPRQDPSGPYAAVIPIFLKRLLANERPIIYGDGLQTRDFTYVGNVVRANLLAAERPGVAGRTFNIGSGSAVSLLELLRRIGTLLGVPAEAEFAPARAGDVRDSLADIALAQSLLGYEPTIDLDEGLRLTVAAQLPPQ